MYGFLQKSNVSGSAMFHTASINVTVANCPLRQALSALDAQPVFFTMGETIAANCSCAL
ncbi:hypothetical protein AM571_PC00693 (plasmid) [Rhizobium etli 8C-3]|uniref:Uncharacterized protein n=1 Tax=Rhizobium etli 8C-3 TaxID=538025 RepID=A0A1L5PDZ9_RHIET|nr:hypothetical protein AM571_PC00693 [Rhizobium etli 8C-3]